MNVAFLFRYWKYMRDGYSIYISLPLGIFNTLTIAYYLFLQNFPALKMFFPHFYIFGIISIVVFVPSSVLAGWWHTKRGRAYATESTILAENNPIYVHNQVIGLYATIEMLKALEKEPSKELLDWFNYWKKLDERG